MATNIVIIDVQLGGIDDIISRSVAELHGEANERLERAIEEKKRVQQLRDKREVDADLAAAAVDRVMQEAYNKLVEAGQNGVPCNDIMDLVRTVVTTTSAFTLRMKTILRKENNKYILKRQQIKKIPHYVFQQFT